MAIPLAAISALPAKIIEYVVNRVLINPSESRLILFSFGLIGMFAANFVVRFLHYYLLRIAVIRINQRIKTDLFEHIMGLSADYFTQQRTGALMSRITNDTQFIDGGIASISSLIKEPFTFGFLFYYALNKSWKLTLITMVLLPPLAWVFSASGRNLKRYIGRMNDQNGLTMSTLQEGFSGIRVVKAFRLEKYLRKKFRDHCDVFERFYLKSAKLEETSHPLVELLSSFVLAALLFVGGLQVLDRSMNPGDLLGFFTAFFLMTNPLRKMNETNLKLHTAAAATDRIFEVFDWKSNLTEVPNPRPFTTFQSSIEFKNVTFSYPDHPEREVLSNVTLSIPKNQTIALVGASGSGKSSLVNLIPRIFDVSKGAISIDGTDIREFTLDTLRDHIAVVSQDVFLFNDTILENIRCGKLSANEVDIYEAAKKAHALEFIEKLPEGFNTRIGDRGQKLSGGQRQRLSIARAFLRESPILILDEATSALDTASERVVQDALTELMEHRTTILIAHRLTTIQHASQIHVIKDGRIIERGTHDQLLELNGEYSLLNRMASTPSPSLGVS